MVQLISILRPEIVMLEGMLMDMSHYLLLDCGISVDRVITVYTDDILGGMSRGNRGNSKKKEGKATDTADHFIIQAFSVKEEDITVLIGPTQNPRIASKVTKERFHGCNKCWEPEISFWFFSLFQKLF